MNEELFNATRQELALFQLNQLKINAEIKKELELVKRSLETTENERVQFSKTLVDLSSRLNLIKGELLKIGESLKKPELKIEVKDAPKRSWLNFFKK